MLTKIRKRVEFWLEGVAKILLKIKFTPNFLTILGFCLSLIAAYFYAVPRFFWYFWIGGTLLFVSSFCDVLDGVVARISGKNTILGGFLDSLMDRYSDTAVIFGITYHFAQTSIFYVSGYIWGFLAIAGSITVSYTRAKAESLNIKLEGVGLAERPERILIIIGSSVFLHPEISLVILAILTNVTVFQRTIFTFKKLKKLE